MNKSKMTNKLKNYINELIKVLDSLKKNKNSKIDKISKKLIDVCQSKNRKILVCGNGGSATDADHFVTELIIRFKNNSRKSIPAISLSSNSGLITAAGNDLGFENIFKRQLESLANKNDCVILISTSGNSRNLIEAAKFTKKKNIYTIGLLGSGGGKLLKYCNTSYVVPSKSVARIQEVHIFLLHFFCELIDNSLLKK